MNKQHRVCTYPECNNRHKAKGFCDVHYARFLRYGSPDIVKKPKHKYSDICSVQGCGKEYFALGFCRKHYRVSRAPKHVLRQKPPRATICIVKDCEKPAKVLELCYSHYDKQRKYGNVLLGREPYQRRNGHCKVIGCMDKIAAKGLCQNHYYIFSQLPSTDYTKPFTCYICGKEYKRFPTRRHSDNGEQLSIDHVIPIAKGGTDDESNLKIACMSCNIKKHSMTYAELLIWCKKVIANHYTSTLLRT